MVAGSFVVFIAACIALFFSPLIAFLLWLLSVVMLMWGLTQASRVKKANVIDLREPASEPFREDGSWYRWEEGVLMAFNESFESWYPAAASAKVRPQSLLPQNLVARES